LKLSQNPAEKTPYQPLTEDSPLSKHVFWSKCRKPKPPFPYFLDGNEDKNKRVYSFNYDIVFK
jgi:hypothetical protein